MAPTHLAELRHTAVIRRAVTSNPKVKILHHVGSRSENGTH
jgi:hypothetical protein